CYGSASRGRRFSRPTRVGRTFTGRGRNRLRSLGAIKKSRRETAGMFRSSKTVLVICLALALAGCSSATNKQKGAVIGGTTGAVIGGVVGKQAGNTAAGAIIGAVVGGTAGVSIGGSMDKQAEERAEIEGAQVEIGRASSRER